MTVRGDTYYMGGVKNSFLLMGRVGSIFLILLMLGLGTRNATDENTAPLPSGADEFDRARGRMIKKDLEGRDITHRRVLEAMSRIPRHEFVPAEVRHKAYNDHPLPIGEGQTISQPYIVALMTQLLDPEPADRVLEIGTGSGYQAAVLAELVAQVYTVEIRPGLCRPARKRLKRIGYENVSVKCADGYFGWEEHAPFDAIIITAAADHIPPPLLRQLKAGGTLIIPLGSTTYYQTLTLVRKQTDESFAFEEKSGVVFVPLIGEVRRTRNR